MHVLRVELFPVSQAKFCGIRIGSFVFGERYSITAKVTNLGTEIFPGGRSNSYAVWGGVKDYIAIDYPAIEPNKEWQSSPRLKVIWSDGPGNFCVDIINAKDGKQVQVFDALGNEVSYDAPVSSVGARTWEELYTLGALVVSAAGLIIVAAADLPQAIQNMSQALQWLWHFILSMLG